MTSEEAIIHYAHSVWDIWKRAWKVRKARIERDIKALEEQIRRLEQKRRQYSWQQAEGIISEEELRKVFKQTKSEESVINEQMSRLQQFRREPAPLDMTTFKKLAEFWPIEITSNLAKAPDSCSRRRGSFWQFSNCLVKPSD